MEKVKVNPLTKFIRKPKNLEENEDLEFMNFNWVCGDYKIDGEKIEKFHIFIYGVDKKNRSVCLNVRGFVPHFFVKVPMSWSDTEMRKLKYKVQKNLYNHKDHLVSVKLMNKKDIDGFNNGRLFKYVRFVFDNQQAMNRAKWSFKKPIEGFESIKFRLYNVKSPPELVFSYIQDILFCGWIKVKRNFLTEIKDDLSRCQLCYSCNWKKVRPVENNETAKIVTLSYDIECYSYNGDFPDPEVLENVITQIGSGFSIHNSNEVLKHIIVLGECEDIPDAVLEVCKTEKELITKWVELIEKTDPDLIIGYNIDNFDWNYIWVRAEMLGISHVVGRLTRFNLIQSEFKDDTLESNAYGMNYFKYINTPGINQLDLLHWFRKNKKLDSYSLDNVSMLYLDNKKHPVTPKQIFKMSGPEGTSKERAIVAAYCCHDTFLPVKLMDMFCMVVNLIEMAKVTRVPFMYLILRGESIKVYSQIAYEARKENFLIPQAERKGDVPFKGATVLPPEYAAYTVPVSGLDFASLYPSIMIAWNLCPTTFVKNTKYDNLENVDYHHFQWDGGNYKFVQNIEGLVPGILTRLWSGRKHVKKEMGAAFKESKAWKQKAEEEQDPKLRVYQLEQSEKMKVLGNVLNGKQLAIKVSMNSIYGAFGAHTFYIPCKPISATVTYVGRQMIDHSKNFAETHYDGSEKAKIIRNVNDEIEIENGETKKIKDLKIGKDKILTPSGHWKEVKKIEKVYKINTKSGKEIFVTENNPLLNLKK